MDLFTAAASGSTRMSFTLPGRPFSRTYGANLPSSLTIVSSLTSVFSTCPPVRVVDTDTYFLPKGFSGRHGFRDCPAIKPAGIAPRRNAAQDFPTATGYVLAPGQPSPGFS